MYNGVNFYELAPQFDQYGECLHPTAVDPNTTRIFSSPVDHDNSGSFNSDEFRMYHYKIKRCPRTRSHDWTSCPYAHRGEKAQRRDPRRYKYAAIACPSFRDGVCYRGDECEFAHGVFEYWLHPARYRTRVCNAGVLCTRKVCFFAHTPSQLRIPPEASKAFMCCRHHHLGHYDYRAVDNNNNIKGGSYSADAAAPVYQSAASTGAESSSNAANPLDADAADRFSELLSTLKLSDKEEVGSNAVNYKSIIHRLPPDGDDLLDIDWVAEFLK